MLSPSSRVALAFAITTASLSATVFAQNAKLPITVERASASKDNRSNDNAIDLNIDLVNSGPRTAIAWAYWIELRLDDGTTRRISATSDALPASEPENYVLPAKARRTDTHQLPDVRPAEIKDVSVHIAAVIFDDSTAAGDEHLLDGLFARRAEYRETWNALSTIVGSARARHSDPSMVLETLKADLEAADPKIRMTGEWRLLRQRVMAAVRSPGGEAARSALDDITRRVDSRKGLFQTQATRRPNK